MNAFDAFDDELPVEEQRANFNAISEINAHRMRMETKKNNAALFGLYAGIVAFVILLWNIIWHTAHWIWMGRKES